MTLKLGIIKIALFLLTCLLIFESKTSSAAKYEFTLSGFDGVGSGGRITGSFIAEDTATHIYANEDNGWQPYSKPNPDGIIYSCPFGVYGCEQFDFDYQYNDIVKEFSITFSGNPFFEKLNRFEDNKPSLLSLSGKNLRIIYYSDLSGNGVHFEPAAIDKSNYDRRGYFVYLRDGSEFGYSRTLEGFRVSPVPIPGAIILFFSGLMSLVFLRRKA